MNKTLNIVVIGCGQLGSRYIQGFAKSTHTTHIYGVDVNDHSLSVSTERFNEIKSETANFHAVKSISDCPEAVFLVVIATNSDIREKVLEQASAYFNYSFLILEKVLFQSLNQYLILENLLKKHPEKIYINCPRRAYKSYQKLFRMISDEPRMDMAYIGSNWALASNSIHFIDLYCFLTKQSLITVDSSGLFPELLSNKRPGMIEFEGKLNVITDKGVLSLTSKSGISENCLHIATTDFIVEVVEKNGSRIKVKHKKTGKEEFIDFEVEYQSDLSSSILNDLIESNHCKLPDAKNTLQMHKDLLSAFLLFYNSITSQNSLLCPIT